MCFKPWAIFDKLVFWGMKHQRCAILSIACKGYEINQATTLQAPKVRNNGCFLALIIRRGWYFYIKSLIFFSPSLSFVSLPKILVDSIANQLIRLHGMHCQLIVATVKCTISAIYVHVFSFLTAILFVLSKTKETFAVYIVSSYAFFIFAPQILHR